MTESAQTSLAARDVVRMAQIVALALISGVVLVALVVLLMSNPLGGAGQKPGARDARPAAGESETTGDQAPSLPVLPLVGVVVAIAAAGASFVLPGAVVKGAAESGAGSRMNRNPYVTRTILALAPLEGAALVNLVLEFVEPSGIGVGVAGVVLLLMLAHFPTVSRYETFAKRLREQADLEVG